MAGDGEWCLFDQRSGEYSLYTCSNFQFAKHTSKDFFLQAGSGKSTAMKYITSRPATRIALEKWAGRQEMVIASHYFWIAGIEIQKSLEGLLRTLLFHVLWKVPKVIDALLPEQVGLPPAHILCELKSLVSKLQGEGLGCCFCFFIDGLDEYQGA